MSYKVLALTIMSLALVGISAPAHAVVPIRNFGNASGEDVEVIGRATSSSTTETTTVADYQPVTLGTGINNSTGYSAPTTSTTTTSPFINLDGLTTHLESTVKDKTTNLLTDKLSEATGGIGSVKAYQSWVGTKEAAGGKAFTNIAALAGKFNPDFFKAAFKSSLDKQAAKLKSDAEKKLKGYLGGIKF